jgi:hypothetical protein|tara:strand:+ start:202 stop:360 length:159 start_codon:yes stop_codon:yes gene_type:complete
MKILKKIWNFLFGKQEEPVVEAAAEELTVDHCGSHLRFRKHCPDCLRVVALI